MQVFILDCLGKYDPTPEQAEMIIGQHFPLQTYPALSFVQLMSFMYEFRARDASPEGFQLWRDVVSRGCHRQVSELHREHCSDQPNHR